MGENAAATAFLSLISQSGRGRGEADLQKQAAAAAAVDGMTS